MTQPYPVLRNTYGLVMDAFSPPAGAGGSIDCLLVVSDYNLNFLFVKVFLLTE